MDSFLLVLFFYNDLLLNKRFTIHFSFNKFIYNNMLCFIAISGFLAIRVEAGIISPNNSLFKIYTCFTKLGV